MNIHIVQFLMMLVQALSTMITGFQRDDQHLNQQNQST